VPGPVAHHGDAGTEVLQIERVEVQDAAGLRVARIEQLEAAIE
jgi:hypothetical protein